MAVDSRTGVVDAANATDTGADDPLRPLVSRQFVPDAPGAAAGVVLGELVAVTEDGLTPFVVFSGQPGSSAVRARTTIDLHGAHIGVPVVLVFEGADLLRPIVIGVVRDGRTDPLAAPRGSVDVDADGERLIVSARNQLVLRCGKARITLTHAGKILLEGAYISSRSSGVNRIRGGSIQLN